MRYFSRVLCKSAIESEVFRSGTGELIPGIAPRRDGRDRVGGGGGGGILLNYYIRVRRNAAGIWEWGEGEEGRTEEGGEGLQ